MIHKVWQGVLIFRAVYTDVMNEDDTGQEMQKMLDIKCEVEWNEDSEDSLTSTIAIKREIGEECDVKKEMEDERLPSNPLMVAANQLHNLKVQLGPNQFIIL